MVEPLIAGSAGCAGSSGTVPELYQLDVVSAAAGMKRGSAAFELGGALLDEGAHALALVVGAEEGREGRGLELVGGRERHVGPAGDDALDRGDGQGALARDLLRHLAHSGHQLRPRHHRVHQADAQRLLGRQRVARHAQLARARLAHATRHALRECCSIALSKMAPEV